MELSMLYFLVSGSAITDLYRKKIFNKWLIAGIFCAVIATFAGWSSEPFLQKTMRAVFTLILLLPVYAMGGLGAGDVKLFTVMAFFLSQQELLSVIIISFVIGAVIGLVKAVMNRNLGETIHFAVPMLISVLLVTNTQGVMLL